MGKNKLSEPTAERLVSVQLAAKLYDMAVSSRDNSLMGYEESIDRLAYTLEPYICVPSRLKVDIELVARGCMRIMHQKSDGDKKAFDELKEFISKNASTTMTETNSVPAECTKAYRKAVELLRRYMTGFSNRDLYKDVEAFLKKPDPFKEAIITYENTGPILIPFDLKAAQGGAKVVTRDGRNVKIVADNIAGTHPILALIINTDESIGVTYASFTNAGRKALSGPCEADLFILKDQDTILVHILKDKHDGTIYAATEEFIKRNDVLSIRL